MASEVERTKKDLQSTIQSIADTKQLLKNEHAYHSDTVESLKKEITRTKNDIVQIQDETYATAVEARKTLTEKQSAQTLAMQSKRMELHAEISQLKDKIAKDATIHYHKVSHLEKEILELQQKKADVISKTSAEMAKTESELQRLTDEYTKNKVVLDQLEQRLELEQKEEAKLKEEEAKRVEEEANAKALQEKQHYAALWIQLQYKRFRKRQALKQQKKKGKGKKNSKKKKK